MAAEVNYFGRLPSELLVHIYIQTANATFPLVCKDVYYALSNEHARFHFCANVWDPTCDWGPEIPDLSKPQTVVVAQNWFNPQFAQKVEEECQRRVVGGHQRVVPRTVPGARLPPYCLRSPWTDTKADLLVRLTGWNVRANWSRERLWYPSLLDAIRQGRENVVSALIGPAVNAKIATSDLIEAVDTCSPETIVGALLRVFLSYDDIGEDLVTTIMDHVAEKANAAVVLRRYNRLKRIAALQAGKDESMENAGCIMDWTSYADTFSNGDEFAKAWEVLEDEYGSALTASVKDSMMMEPGGINADIDDDDGPCPPGPWLRLNALIEDLRRGSDFSSDYEAEMTSDSQESEEDDQEDEDEEEEEQEEEK